MTDVLTDNELLALYDRWDHVPGAPDTGIGVDMGVEGERRAMWAARAAYVEAHRVLSVAILRRHEGRLARALEAREVRGWIDALAKVLGLVEAPCATRPIAVASNNDACWHDLEFNSVLRTALGKSVALCWLSGQLWLWSVGTLRGCEITRLRAKHAACRALQEGP